MLMDCEDQWIHRDIHEVARRLTDQQEQLAILRSRLSGGLTQLTPTEQLLTTTCCQVQLLEERWFALREECRHSSQAAVVQIGQLQQQLADEASLWNTQECTLLKLPVELSVRSICFVEQLRPRLETSTVCLHPRWDLGEYSKLASSCSALAGWVRAWVTSCKSIRVWSDAQLMALARAGTQLQELFLSAGITLAL